MEHAALYSRSAAFTGGRLDGMRLHDLITCIACEFGVEYRA